MNSFDFKFLDCVPYERNDKHYSHIIAYCSFGFIVHLFTSVEKAKVIVDDIDKTKNTNITKYVKVYYDNKKQQFAYIINIK